MYEIERYPAKSGRVIGEDGKVYNLVDLLKSMGGGSMDPNEYYTKTETDGKYQAKGSYATVAQVNGKANTADVTALEARVKALEDAAGGGGGG